MFWQCAVSEALTLEGLYITTTTYRHLSTHGWVNGMCMTISLIGRKMKAQSLFQMTKILPWVEGELIGFRCGLIYFIIEGEDIRLAGIHKNNKIELLEMHEVVNSYIFVIKFSG
jgi:hypothetical protein